ncbi:MAG: hypothetical protein PHO80_04555, partial [Candidatus Gracilibacteria bacterium]|nr:hypothetical protein [Candidatus Gracilibacteria bacterium]
MQPKTKNILDNSFDILTKILLILLPFHVFISVFFEFKIGMSFFPLYKELILVLLSLSLARNFYKNNSRPKFDKLDYLIFAYFGYLILVTLVDRLGLKSLFYGARYDFEFFFVFLLMKHGRQFLQKPVSYYIKLFLLSGGAAIFIGVLVRFIFKETILINFGFSAGVSQWDIGGSVPIYHSIEGANVRRFQGIFDGPNQAAYFLLVYIGVLLHYFRNNKDYQFVAGCIVIGLFGLIFMTYSRSS